MLFFIFFFSKSTDILKFLISTFYVLKLIYVKI